jgi:hypothetical protein
LSSRDDEMEAIEKGRSSRRALTDHVVGGEDELEKAKAKFRDVDEWEMEFEDFTIDEGTTSDPLAQ